MTLYDELGEIVTEKMRRSTGHEWGVGPTMDALMASEQMQALRKLVGAVADFGMHVIDEEALMTAYYDLPESIHEWGAP